MKVEVNFIAFDRENTEVFINKSFNEIHNVLTEICNTHIIKSVVITELNGILDIKHKNIQFD